MHPSELVASPSKSHRKHVLLISPLTFSYHISISETLRSMGYEVTWWDERASSATWYKVSLRMIPRLTRLWSESFFLKQLRKLDPEVYSHVLVIKGEGLSQKVVLDIRKSLSNASMGLYLWDSVKNVKGVSAILQAFDSVATFDPVDAEKLGWTYRPLFWRNVSNSTNNAELTLYDWSFIGTIHSDRHSVIHRLRQRNEYQSESYVYAFFQSSLILFMRMFTDWTLWLAPKGSLSTTPMPASAVAQIVARSKAVLDVEHPRQRGFTMRTIETLLAGKKLVTTNKHILNSNLYHPSRIHVISRVTPEIPAVFYSEPFFAVSDTLKNYYSCEGWASELLMIQDAKKKSRFDAVVNSK